MKLRVKPKYEGVLVESVSALDEKTLQVINKYCPEIIQEYFIIE